MSHFQLFVGLKTDQGRVRANNEDAINYALPNNPDALLRQGALFVVADGVGGRSGGKEISQFVAQNIVAYIGRCDPQQDSVSCLRQSIEQVNTEVFEAPGDGATTLLVAHVSGKYAHIAHVGDCSAFWLYKGKLTKLTRDHLMPNPANPLKQKLARAVGHTATIEIDFIKQTLSEGGYLILVSDGVTRHLSESALAQIVQSSPPEQSVEHVVAAANAAGGEDNISAIIVQVGSRIKQASKLPWVLGITILALLVALGAFFVLSGSESSDPPSPSRTATSSPSPITPTLTTTPTDLPPTATTVPTEITPTEATPTERPTNPPTASPSPIPPTVTERPTDPPTASPTRIPPTERPTSRPTATPTRVPPTQRPTNTATVISFSTSATDTVIDVGDRVMFEEAGTAYLEAGQSGTAFFITPNRPYQVDEELVTPDNMTWYALIDLRNEQKGWIREDDLPPYAILE